MCIQDIWRTFDIRMVWLKGGKCITGFKSEWAAVKQRKLFVGGLGKEWTTNSGEAVNTHPQWVKTVSPTGEVEHHNWYQKYLSVRRVLGIEFPGMHMVLA
jgi:soluble calcium-activated nucleotidase 1